MNSILCTFTVFEICKNVQWWILFVFLVSIFDVFNCSSIKRTKKFPRTFTHTKCSTDGMNLFRLLYLFTLCKYLFLKWLYIDSDENFFLYSTIIDVCRMVFVKRWSILIEQLILCMNEGKKVKFFNVLFFYSLQHS